VPGAEKAVKDRNYELAVSLWMGVVEIRGYGDDSVWKLVEAYELAGEFDDATVWLERYVAVATDATKKQKAVDEITALKTRPRGFSQKGFRPQSAKKEAAEAFKRGRAAFKAKKYAEAVQYFKAGAVMAPDLPGNYRELGQAYDKLGQANQANVFFVQYLQMRPFGKNADEIRPRLVKANMVGKLTIESALPCDDVVINGQLVPKKLPVKDHVVAPGKYKLLCYSDKYRYAYYEKVEVKVGATAKVSFDWAIIENKLEPWGRIVIENADDPGKMQDVGLFPEVGVPVPKDRRALKVRITDGADKTKTREEFLKLEPGKRYVLKW
jgi:tetratricopeptide (TPR) repeat protein